MIRTASTSASPLSFSENRPESHPNPLIQRLERGPVAVLEIFEPAHQAAVDLSNDDLQALPVVTMRVLTNGVFEFPEALGSRPSRFHPFQLFCSRGVDERAAGDAQAFGGVVDALEHLRSKAQQYRLLV